MGRQSATDLADLPGAEKVRLIRRLLQGWVTDDDVTAVEQLCTSVRTSAEMRVINGRIRPMTSSLNNFDQRARVRLALDRRP